MTCTVNAVVNDGQYMLAPSLQQGFLDIRTGLPLSGGIVTFYRDVDHTALKPIFTISGPPDAPIFTQLPNPLTLSAIGTFQDPTNNQDIIPYYFPYDADGNVDLYYITVYSSDNFLQFTRDHFPSVADIQPSEIVQAESFAPDGQFLLHYNLPDNGLVNSSGNYAIAYGGWFFIISTSGSSNFVTFPRFDSPINSPVADPRYAVRIQCTVSNPADSSKDLALLIEDVNFLQGQQASFQVTAFTNDSSSHTAQFIIQQNFGTGGSAAVQTVIGTLVITPGIQDFLFNFTIPSTIGKTLGANDDDYLQLILRSPLASTSDISYTNVIFVPGTFTALAYPPTSPEQAKSFALPASFDIPAYDGSDIGKVVTLGFSSTAILPELAFIYLPPIPPGTLLFSGMPGSTPPAGGYLYCDNSEYAIENSPNATITAYPDLYGAINSNWGTGYNGFTYGIPSGNTVYIYWNRFDVLQPAPQAHTSGFTFTLINPVTIGSVQQIYNLTSVAAASISPGAYFIIPVNTTGPQFLNMLWFTIDGVGTIPNVTYDAAREVPLLSSDTAVTVITKLNYAIFQVPDARGYFPRVWSQNSGNDPDASTRTRSGTGSGSANVPYVGVSGAGGNNVGSLQADEFASHDHPGSVFPYNIFELQAGGSTFNSIVSGGTASAPVTVAFEGGAETRPVNFYVNCFIKT